MDVHRQGSLYSASSWQVLVGTYQIQCESRSGSISSMKKATLCGSGCPRDCGHSHTSGRWIHCRNNNGWAAVIYNYTVIDVRGKHLDHGQVVV